MESLRFRSWKDFSLGWWNVLASAWFPDVRHFEIWHRGSNFALVYAIVHENPWMDIRESWRNCPWQYFRSFDRGIIILSVFMAPDRVVLHASRNKSHRKLLTCFGRAGLSFREHKRRMARFVRAAVELLRQCFINPWIQTALFLIIAIVATSAAVSWQFAGWISPIPPRLYSTAVNKVWCLQCGQMF